MKRVYLPFILAIVILGGCRSANVGDQGGGFDRNAPLDYQWVLHSVDDRYDPAGVTVITEAIGRYDDLIEPLQEIVGHSTGLIYTRRPESPLSNFAADALRFYAQETLEREVHIGITNFGGIRSDLPSGAIRVYDIYSVFPFDNYLALVDIKGSNLRKIFTRMASRGSVEALSGVEIGIDSFKLVKCNIGGRPLDDSKTYTVATIDFLLNGGDSMKLREFSEKTEVTGHVMRDLYVQYLKGLTDKGIKLTPDIDNRITIVNCEK